MFCPNCGTMNNDNSTACSNCGAPLSSFRRPEQQPAQQSYAQPQQPTYGSAPQPAQRAPYPPQPAQNGYGSGTVIAPPQRTFDFYPFWFKFMSYAGFFITSLGFFFIGLGQLIGWQYGSISGFRFVEGIKESFGGLRAADIISGILFLLMSVASIYVWYQFRYLRAKAPTYTLALYGAAAGIYTVYFLIDIIVLAASETARRGGFSATKIFPIAWPIILIVILGAVLAAQIIYFKSEKPRFIYYPQPKPAATYPQNSQYGGYAQDAQQNNGYAQNQGYQQNPSPYQQNSQSNQQNNRYSDYR